MEKIPMNAARVAAGLTQEELAREMGVSRQCIIAWESGKRTMKAPYFYMFCRITGFSEDDIFLPERST